MPADDTIIGYVSAGGKKYLLRYDKLLVSTETGEISNEFTVQDDIYDLFYSNWQQKQKDMKNIVAQDNSNEKEPSTTPITNTTVLDAKANYEQRLQQQKNIFANKSNERIKEVKERAEADAQEKIKAAEADAQQKIDEANDKTGKALEELASERKNAEETIARLEQEKEQASAQARQTLDEAQKQAQAEVEKIEAEKQRIIEEKKEAEKQANATLEEEKQKAIDAVARAEAEAKTKFEEERKSLEAEAEAKLQSEQEKHQQELNDFAARQEQEKADYDKQIALQKEETERLQRELAESREALKKASKELDISNAEKQEIKYLAENEKKKIQQESQEAIERQKEAIEKQKKDIEELENSVKQSEQKVQELEAKEEERAKDEEAQYEEINKRYGNTYDSVISTFDARRLERENIRRAERNRKDTENIYFQSDENYPPFPYQYEPQNPYLRGAFPSREYVSKEEMNKKLQEVVILMNQTNDDYYRSLQGTLEASQKKLINTAVAQAIDERVNSLTRLTKKKLAGATAVAIISFLIALGTLAYIVLDKTGTLQKLIDIVLAIWTN